MRILAKYVWKSTNGTYAMFDIYTTHHLPALGNILCPVIYGLMRFPALPG